MKKYMIASLILCIFISIAVPAAAEEASENNQNANLDLAPGAISAILMERDTGEILYNKNVHEELPPASMTKIMTLLLIMEALDQDKLALNEMVRISEHAASMGGSQIFLEAGEEMSVEDLLKGIAIASGNDASVALAERIAGSEDAFVKKMNEKAKDLGLKNTHFQNTTGLPAEGHYSTAHDLAIMAQELLKYESITDYTSIYEDYLRKGEDNEFWLVNTNKLVKFYPGVDGLKTGFTSQAKYGLTATAKKDDMRVIAVVMGAETTKERNKMISSMLDYAFNHYETKKLFKKNETITNIQLLKAEENRINIAVSKPVSTIHEKGEAPEEIVTSVELYKNITPPMKKGDHVGELVVRHDGKTISTTPLVVTHDVHQASFFTLFKRAMGEMVKEN